MVTRGFCVLYARTLLHFCRDRPGIRRPMPFELPPLAHNHAALEPHLPVDAVDQRRREQQAHLDAVNAAVDGGLLAEASLEHLAREARGALAAHAAEA